MRLLRKLNRIKTFPLFISITASVLLASTILITVGLITYYQVRSKTLKDEVITQKRQQAQEIAHELEAYLVSTRQLAKSTATLVAKLPSTQRDVEALIAALLSSASPETIYGIGVWYEPYQFLPNERFFGPYVHRNGDRIVPILTYEWTTPEYNFHQQPWYLAGKKAQGETVFTEPYFDTDLIYMTVTQAFFDKKTNRASGVITVDMILPYLRQLVAQRNKSKNEIIYVLTQKNKVFVYPNEQRLIEFARNRGKAPKNILDLNQDDINAFHKTRYSQNRLQVSATVADAGWTVYISANEAYWFQKANNLYFTIASILGGFWLTVSFALVALYRIGWQADKARRAREKLQAEILQRKQAEETLTKINEELEHRVQERTLQLKEAHDEILTLNQKLKSENLRMSAELDILQEMQQLILPKPMELEAIGDLDIAGFMEPADEVGGDYYDVLYTDGVVTIGIGDVTGHGLESGILMVMTQTAVRTLNEIREYDPIRFLDTLNRIIYKNVSRMNSDKNLSLAILNYACGRLSISGQHEEAIVVRKEGQIERINTIDLGFPIGLDEQIADFISHQTVELESGDGVVLYTDGIPEAIDINEEFYGLERLCAVVTQNWHKNTEEIKQAVIDDLRQFIGHQKMFDDITLVVMKRQEEQMVKVDERSLALNSID